MASMIERPETAFSLSPRKTKRPRREDGEYLKAVRTLPCVVCLRRPVEAAHIRTGNMLLGKRETGIAERPSDQWVLPLCPDHHRVQHSGNELDFYRKHGIDPFLTALALWGSRHDEDAMFVIIQNARSRT